MLLASLELLRDREKAVGQSRVRFRNMYSHANTYIGKVVIVVFSEAPKNANMFDTHTDPVRQGPS